MRTANKTAGTPSPHPCPLFEKSGAKTLLKTTLHVVFLKNNYHYTAGSHKRWGPGALAPGRGLGRIAPKFLYKNEIRPQYSFIEEERWCIK